MRAVMVNETGEPSVLKVCEVGDPEVGPGQARIRVAAAGVNFADVVMRRGHIPSPLPMIPGVEGAGVVESLGTGVTNLSVGDRVAWAPVMGGGAIVGSYAELECVAEDALIPVPESVSLETAAAVMLQGLTAHYLVHDKKKIEPGTNVLIHAAAGGMGLLLCGWMKRLGADETILYNDEDFAARALELTGGKGVDYVVDGVGKTTFAKNLDCMASQGHICLYGMASGPPDPISPLLLLPKAICVSGGMMTNFLRSRDEVLRKGAEVFAGVEAGWLAPPQITTIPLAEASRAHAMLEDRQSVGKLVLQVSP
jgi:NADPH2:quinone reductase